jgi:molybdate transport system substrate-binding protein
MWRRVSTVFLLCAALASCAGPKDVEGHITVFAATSLTGAFTDIGEAFEAAYPGTKVTFNFAASSSLVAHIQSGSPADVVAMADARTMRAISTEWAVLAHNRLVLATKPGNPAHITRLADLADASTVSLCAAEVPCGAYAAETLRKAGVTLDDSRVTRGQNAAAALSAVSDGDAVAAIVYLTDAKAAGARVAAITIPDADNVVAEYPIAAIRPSAKARAFIAFVLEEEGQRILKRYGFIT